MTTSFKVREFLVLRPRLAVAVWSATWAAVMAWIGFGVDLLDAEEQRFAWSATVALCGAVLGGSLGCRLRSAAERRAWIRGGLWGVLGSFLTVQLAAFPIVWLEYEGYDLEVFPTLVGIPILTLLFGWWLIVPAGLVSGIGFVVAFRLVVFGRR